MWTVKTDQTGLGAPVILLVLLVLSCYGLNDFKKTSGHMNRELGFLTSHEA